MPPRSGLDSHHPRLAAAARQSIDPRQCARGWPNRRSLGPDANFAKSCLGSISIIRQSPAVECWAELSRTLSPANGAGNFIALWGKNLKPTEIVTRPVLGCNGGCRAHLSRRERALLRGVERAKRLSWPPCPGPEGRFYFRPVLAFPCSALDCKVGLGRAIPSHNCLRAKLRRHFRG